MKSISACLLMAILLLIVTSCKEKGDPSVTEKLAGNWKVVSFNDLANDTIITKTAQNTLMDENNGDITLTFTLNESTNGDITGINVINAFEADFLADEYGHMMISNLSFSTSEDEPEWAQLFHSFADAQSFVIDNQQLTIYYHDGDNTMVLSRQE